MPSRNALIIAALKKYLTELEQREIDKQFETIAEDDAYTDLNKQISESFMESDWEAFIDGELK